MSPLAPVVLSRVMVAPETDVIDSPLMIVFGRNESVVGIVQTMWNVAPDSGAPASLVLRTEMLPPTMKQAGPALRLLACDVDGDCVVFAKLQYRPRSGCRPGSSM